ncbi:MAG: glycosyltransferase [Alphaproteobacteria bacterium]
MLVTLVDDSIPFNGSTPANQPLGGAEKAFASLPPALARRGHVVRAFNRTPYAMGIDNVSWVNWDGRRPPITEALIAYRKPSLLEFTRAIGQRVLWVAGHAAYLNTTASAEILTRTGARLVFSAEAQRKTYKGDGKIRALTIQPAVRDDYRNAGPMEAKGKAPVAIVTSHPKHGVDWLIGLWVAKIKPRVPDAELHIYSASLHKAETANKPVPDELKPVHELIKGAASSGVSIKGPGGDVQMARYYRGARVHLYPGFEHDLMCMTLLESQAVGVPAVCRPLGAVEERIEPDNSGFLGKTDDEFAEHAVRLLSDDAAFDHASTEARANGRTRSWENVASEFEAIFR